MGKLHKTRPGFTLFELILVIMLIVFLFSVGLNGMVRTQASYQFNDTVQKVLTMIRKARSYAITGKAMPDYTDFDKDGCKLAPEDVAEFTNGTNNYYSSSGNAYGHNISSSSYPICLNPSVTDYITPANYGIFFHECRANSSYNNRCTINLFADINTLYEDYFYNASWLTGSDIITNFKYSENYGGNDVLLEKYTLPSNIYITTLTDPPTITAIYNRFGILYSPVFADVKLGRYYNFLQYPYLTSSLKFKIQRGLSSSITHQRCFQIHKVSGNPEEIPCP
jgi:type II secretory pathway pseudopilin PulG